MNDQIRVASSRKLTQTPSPPGHSTYQARSHVDRLEGSFPISNLDRLLRLSGAGVFRRQFEVAQGCGDTGGVSAGHFERGQLRENISVSQHSARNDGSCNDGSNDGSNIVVYSPLLLLGHQCKYTSRHQAGSWRTSCFATAFHTQQHNRIHLVKQVQITCVRHQ